MGIFGSYIDNQVDNISTAYEGMDTNPYNTIPKIMDGSSSVTDIAMLPLKFSFRINTLRQMKQGMNAIGMTSSLADPFSEASYMNRRWNAHGAVRYKGVIGNILDKWSRLGIENPNYDPGNVRNEFNDWARYKTKDEFIDGMKAARMKGTPMKPGAIEKWVLSKKRFHRTMGKVNPGYMTGFAGSEDQAYENFFNKVYNSRNNNFGFKTAEGSKQFINGYMNDIHSARKETLKDFLFKKDIKQKMGASFEYADMSNPNRKLFSLFGKGRSLGERNTMGAAYEGLRESMVGSMPNGALTKEAIGELEDYTNMVGRRLGLVRKLKGAMWIGGGAMAALPLAATALKAYMEVPTRMASTLQKLNRSDFGSGEMLQNSSIATERQRALAAIRDGQLNARSIIGNEAAFMH